MGGRSDYTLGIPPHAVLEAKREAKKFDLLPTKAHNLVRKLKSEVEACKVLKEAVLQVIPYCSMRGAPIAVVCNGPQLVVFQAYIAGNSPLESECFVFDGFLSLLNNFTLLWRILSPEGVFENRALRELANYRNPRIPTKASTTIAEPFAYRYRSRFQENLRLLATVLLENIDDNPDIKAEFFRECYVALEANNRHLLLSKKVIAARYRRASDSGIAPAALSAKVKKGKIEIDDDLNLGSASSRPIIVLGDVGVGKTSFFENIFQQLDHGERERTLYIHINLGRSATLSKDVRSFILAAIPNVLAKKYKINIQDADFVEKIYSDEMTAFEDSVEGKLRTISKPDYDLARIRYLTQLASEEDSHLIRSLEHLAKINRKQILLVIDNADQRNFETQQDAFLIAQEIAHSMSVLVFVALRPSTFYQSKMTGALSGYQNRVLTISPPPADEVIRKRVTFAVRVAEGKIETAALADVTLNIDSIVQFLKATLRSIKTNEMIRTFLSNITGGNIRLVIELFSGFCGSPNVDSEQIVNIERDKGNYVVPLHEFTKHALLGEYAHYNPGSSLVACNVFDISSADPKEHFLSSLTVAYLGSSLGIKDNDGFVSGSDIIKEAHRLGFSDDQIRWTLRRLAKSRLIETPYGHYREVPVEDDKVPDNFHFRATSIGLYHIRHWIAQFSFLDATSIDSPIFDEPIRKIIFLDASSYDIGKRFRRAESFKSYLGAVWHQSNFDVSYFDLIEVFDLQRQSFDSVKKFLDKRR